MRKRESGRRTGGALMALAVASGAMILALGGCGQSGPLYLPKKSSLSASAPSPVSVALAVAGRRTPDAGRRTPVGGRGESGTLRSRLNISETEFC